MTQIGIVMVFVSEKISDWRSLTYMLLHQCLLEASPLLN